MNELDKNLKKIYDEAHALAMAKNRSMLETLLLLILLELRTTRTSEK